MILSRCSACDRHLGIILDTTFFICQDCFLDIPEGEIADYVAKVKQNNKT